MLCTRARTDDACCDPVTDTSDAYREPDD